MAAIVAVVAAGGALGASSPAVVQVNAVVNSMCRINAGNLDFGSYDPLGVNATSPLDAQFLIGVTCTKVVSGSLSLQPAHGTPAAAYLVSGADQLGYSLFADAARTDLWAGYTTGNGKKKVFEAPVFGRISAGQDIPSGDYLDTVTVRLDF